jgi:hypothetical protein
MCKLPTPYSAAAAGTQEVLKVDRRDFKDACRSSGIKLSAADYTALVVFEGHCNTVLWAWQL